MSQKIRIADAGNVTIPAYLTLKQKGFTVRCVRTAMDSDQETWFAEDATREFIANDLVALLGLIAIHETRGDDWQASDEEIEAFLSTY